MSMTVIMNKEYKLEPIPEVGKEYHFWDDGKSSPSRHYICRCERVIKPQEAKKINFDLLYYPHGTKTDIPIPYTKSLYDIWKDAVIDHYWLMAEDTDAFVEVSCPSYDENNLWAARTKFGGWFTLDIQSSWQGGDIDVTGEKFKNIVEQCYDDGDWDLAEEYKEETYE